MDFVASKVNQKDMFESDSGRRQVLTFFGERTIRSLNPLQIPKAPLFLGFRLDFQFLVV
jgi:hypothetical protein